LGSRGCGMDCLFGEFVQFFPLFSASLVLL
jgi:hypothetical protein